MNNAHAESTLGTGTHLDSTESGKSKSGLAATGGIIGALAASACCLLPLVLTVLGVSGAWMSSLRSLEAYKPYSLTLAIGALAYGFYQVYWKPKKACAEGTACARPMNNRLVKAGLWSGAVLITLVLTFPYFFPLIEPYLP